MNPIDVATLMQEDDISTRYLMARDAFDARRIELANTLREDIKARGVVQSRLADKLEMKPSSLNRAIKPRTGKFGMPLKNLSEFSQLSMGMSAHELLFGKKAATRLPKYLSAIVERLDTRKKIEQAVDLVTEEIWSSESEQRWRKENYDVLSEKGYNITNLIADRLQETAEGRYVTVPLIFGPDAPTVIRWALRLVVERDEEDKERVLKLNTVMFAAMSLETTVDYFSSVDYTRYTDIRLYNPGKNGEDVIVDDKNIIQLVSHYLRLSKEGQKLAYSRLLQVAIQ